MSNFDITKWNKKRYLGEISDELLLSPNDSFQIYDLLKENLGKGFTDKFPHKIKFHNSLKRLQESTETLTIGDLRFGDNVEKGDHLPLHNSDNSRRVNSEEDLNNWLEGKDVNVEVFITPQTPTSQKRFNIPEFEEKRDQVRIGKEKWLNQHKTYNK